MPICSLVTRPQRMRETKMAACALALRRAGNTAGANPAFCIMLASTKTVCRDPTMAPTVGCGVRIGTESDHGGNSVQVRLKYHKGKGESPSLPRTQSCASCSCKACVGGNAVQSSSLLYSCRTPGSTAAPTTLDMGSFPVLFAPFKVEGIMPCTRPRLMQIESLLRTYGRSAPTLTLPSFACFRPVGQCLVEYQFGRDRIIFDRHFGSGALPQV